MNIHLALAKRHLVTTEQCLWSQTNPSLWLRRLWGWLANHLTIWRIDEPIQIFIWLPNCSNKTQTSYLINLLFICLFALRLRAQVVGGQTDSSPDRLADTTNRCWIRDAYWDSQFEKHQWLRSGAWSSLAIAGGYLVSSFDYLFETL